MADHRPDPPVVHCIVGGHREEWRLQDRCRKNDLVQFRVVVGVDHLRRHEPLVAIHRSAEFGHLIVMFEYARPADIAHQVPRDNFQPRVVPPFVRVTDLGPKRRQLGVCLGLRRLRHPLQLIDGIAKRRQQIGDEVHHPGFVLRWEMSLHIYLPQRFGHHGLHQIHPPLPQRTLSRHTPQQGAIESEVGFVQFATEQGRRTREQMPPQVVRPIRQRSFGHQFAECPHKIRLTNVHLRHCVAHTHTGQERRDVQRPAQVRGVCNRHQVVGGLRVTVAHFVPVRPRQLRFQRYHPVGHIQTVPSKTSQRPHPRDVLAVGGPNVSKLGFQVVVAVRQT